MAGVNDVVILMTILVFLTGLGFLSPIIQEALNVGVVTQDTGFEIINLENASASIPASGDWGTGGWYIFSNIFLAIAWVFPWEPPVFVIFHRMLQFTMIVVAFRLVRSGAG